MSFRSGVFLLFLPAAVLLHRLCPRRFRWVVLLAASYYFYMYESLWPGALLLATTAVSYFSARGMVSAGPIRKKLLLAGTLTASLGTLFVFKYMNFFLGTGFSLVLPVGISFYTFQTLSYVLDVYRGTVLPERHFGYYALFVSFFPQLVAGPIERSGDLLPQLRAAGTGTREDFNTGCFWLLRGFGKKVLISDLLAPAVEAVYAAPERADGLAAAAATLLFALQIYCDFSGYSEIALGSARLLGIRLSRNFDRPYAAASLREFWRRWHISLTRWFRDYLYLPLGGGGKGRLRRAGNTLLVFLVSGLWHGANWTFLLWGLYHGLLLLLEDLLPKRPRRLATPLLVVFGWIFFRAATVGQAFTLIARLFTPWRPAAALALLGLDPLRLPLFSLLAVLLVLLDREKPGRLTERRAVCAALLLLAVALAWLSGLNSGADNAFIYFQF